MQKQTEEPHVLKSLQFENELTVKIELNRRPEKMSNRMLARYIFNQLRNIEK